MGVEKNNWVGRNYGFLQMLHISEDCSNSRGGENRQKITVNIKRNLLCCYFLFVSFFLQKKVQILIKHIYSLDTIAT